MCLLSVSGLANKIALVTPAPPGITWATGEPRFPRQQAFKPTDTCDIDYAQGSHPRSWSHENVFKNSGPDKPWNAIHYWPFGASEFWDAHVPIGPFLLRNKPSLQISFLWCNHSILVFVTFWRMTVEMFLSDFSKYHEWRFKIFLNDLHPVCCGTIFCYSAVNCLRLHFIAFDVRVAGIGLPTLRVWLEQVSGFRPEISGLRV